MVQAWDACMALQEGCSSIRHMLLAFQISAVLQLHLPSTLGGALAVQVWSMSCRGTLRLTTSNLTPQ